MDVAAKSILQRAPPADLEKVSAVHHSSLTPEGFCMPPRRSLQGHTCAILSLFSCCLFFFARVHSRACLLANDFVTALLKYSTNRMFTS
jgi:hypothetical protein